MIQLLCWNVASLHLNDSLLDDGFNFLSKDDQRVG